jgi:prolyl oligopeptidase PreP (S9A serine peptidase family)
MIIWLASYPKSGNTMLRTMLSSYLFTNDGSFDFNIMKKISQFPNSNIYDKLGVNYKDLNEVIKNSLRVQESFNKKESVGFVKTHNMLFNFNSKYPFTNLENTLGVIYIVRDPRNVVLSYARHLKISPEEAVKFMTKGKANDMFIMGNWSENFISWKSFSNYNKYLLIKYEDLVSKREETFLKILQFIFRLRNINFEIDSNKLEIVLKNTSFENLKNLEKQKGFRESIKSDDGKQIPFFDKGISRDWSKTLDINLSQEIEKCFKNEMKELGYL